MDNIKHIVVAVAFLLMALWAVPVVVEAQYHGVTHHRVSRRAARVHGPGWSQQHAQQQQQGVPEFDPNAAGAALALLLGGLAVIGSSRVGVSSTRG